MGVALTSLLEKKYTNFDALKGKVLAVDAFNMLYQFLTTIRQRDGAALVDDDGNITSHLNGLFYRCMKFLEHELRLVFVFDGKAPALKSLERAKRREVREQAQVAYDKAVANQDVALMKKYSSRLTHLTPEMVEESKALLDALGIPWIQAPSEGEAQAAHLVKKGDAYAVVSQDADALLFGAPLVIKNLSVAGKRKRTSKFEYITIEPEEISLTRTLNTLGVTQKQLIGLAILIGTDFNPGGVNGLGPKKGLKAVKEHGEDLEALFSSVEWNFDHSWQDVYNTIIDIPVTDDYECEWRAINKEKVLDILCAKHGFAAERIEKSIDDYLKKQEHTNQSLTQWFS